MVGQTVLPTMSFDLPVRYIAPPSPPIQCFYHHVNPPRLKGDLILSTEISSFKEVHHFRAAMWDLCDVYKLHPNAYPKMALAVSEAINNALRSAPGMICKVETRLDRNLSLLTVEIVDHGPGMTPNMARMVLVPLCSGYGSLGVGFTCMFGACGMVEIFSATQGTDTGVTVRLHILI